MQNKPERGGLEPLRLRSLRRTVIFVLALLALLAAALAWFAVCCFEGGIAESGGAYVITKLTLVSTAALLLVYAAAFLCAFIMCIRCRRWKSFSRIVLWLVMWVPVVNLAVTVYFLRIACQEVAAGKRRARIDAERIPQQVCATKYPILLVHGLAFRDFRRFSYWGRIPEELKLNGARVYHGEQEAWGTIENNAAVLRERVMHILEQTGCEKVNIIAHSKGGLDARYMISELGMAPYVASLTTVSTPHRGSALVERLRAVLPDRSYRKISLRVDEIFKKLGDNNPNSYDASLQLSREFAKGFNARCPDADGVLYQSTTGVMKCALSSSSMLYTYRVLKRHEGPNDGLVSESSAKWGEWLGAVRTDGLRGISHTDIIDVRREDIRSFDVLEMYIGIADRLRTRGL